MKIYVLFDDVNIGKHFQVASKQNSIPIEPIAQEYYVNGRIIIREQFPLVPCWGCTILKFQGASLEEVAISLGAKVFEKGMAYVALSRVKCLSGLYLLKFDASKVQPNVKAMMLKIADIRKIEPDSPHETPTVKAVVLNVGQIQKEHGKERLYVVLGDETGSITATIYNPDVFDRFRKNMGVILMDMLLKQSYIGITKRTEVAVTQAFIIPDEVSPATTKPVGGNDVLFQEISLKDSTGKATVAVWDSMVDTIQKGKVINISKCRVRLFNAEKKLSTTKASVLEVVAESELQELPISSDDDDDDADRTDEAAPSHMPVGSVIAVFEVDPYLASPINSCSNKKLVTVLQNELYVMKCSKCNGTFRASTAKTYLRVNTENGNKKCAMFLPTIKQVFESKGIDFQTDFDKTNIMEAIMKIVPFEIRYTLRGTTIVNILMKRKSDSSIVIDGKCLAIDNFLLGQILKEGRYVENVFVKVRQEAKRVEEIIYMLLKFRWSSDLGMFVLVYQELLSTLNGNIQSRLVVVDLTPDVPSLHEFAWLNSPISYKRGHQDIDENHLDQIFSERKNKGTTAACNLAVKKDIGKKQVAAPVREKKKQKDNSSRQSSCQERHRKKTSGCSSERTKTNGQ
ncbi:PIF1 [Mytilus coruscus]|uniref:PIF1 n=1 Tax=Mytilus coruscus TaxID=42192 RepID=A0A6J8BR36_MYTCO|nr:PIF1 [Mytilus coruscus]